MATTADDLTAALTGPGAGFSSIEEAIEAIRRGEIVVVVDDPGRENEGDFVLAAQRVTPEAVNFMVTHGRGIVCMPVMPERARRLGLGLMIKEDRDYDGCAFLVTIADLIAYRLEREKHVRRMAEATIPTEVGSFRAVGYQSRVDGREHIALLFGEPEGKDGVLVRMHSECMTGDVFGSLRCDCG